MNTLSKNQRKDLRAKIARLTSLLDSEARYTVEVDVQTCGSFALVHEFQQRGEAEVAFWGVSRINELGDIFAARDYTTFQGDEITDIENDIASENPILGNEGYSLQFLFTSVDREKLRTKIDEMTRNLEQAKQAEGNELGWQSLATNGYWAYLYARDVIKGPFTLGEPAIAKNGYWAYLYARDVLKGRFELGESLTTQEEITK